MNAVERLWRGIARRDYAAIAAQLHENARIDWPHTGEDLSATEYVVRQRLAGKREVRVQRILVDEERHVRTELTGRGRRHSPRPPRRTGP